MNYKHTHNMKNKNYTPILKWAGGKRQLLNSLRKFYPKKIDTYYEPFLGGASVFFDLNPKNYIISDTNEEIINLYKIISKKPKKLVSELKKMKNDEDFFYKTRKLKHQSLEKIKAAARTLYLNRTCFNGLFRVNQKGEFNVPFGKYKNPDFIQEEKILGLSEILNEKNIITQDFSFLNNINFKKNDFIFLDPPYYPLGGYSDFDRYSSKKFPEKKQIELYNLFKKISKKGIKIIQTNSDTAFIKDIYKDFDYLEIESKININSNGKRRKGKDLIIYANFG